MPIPIPPNCITCYDTKRFRFTVELEKPCPNCCEPEKERGTELLERARAAEADRDHYVALFRVSTANHEAAIERYEQAEKERDGLEEAIANELHMVGHLGTGDRAFQVRQAGKRLERAEAKVMRAAEVAHKVVTGMRSSVIARDQVVLMLIKLIGELARNEEPSE